VCLEEASDSVQPDALVAATNLALHIGGHWVWGEAATPANRTGGITTMALLMGLGTVPGITRTSAVDGVHHTSDVMARRCPPKRDPDGVRSSAP
jgi:hypothetical protein